MAEMKEDASRVHKFATQGAFFIHKKRASACYKYTLPAVPVPNVPNLTLSLEYNSACSGDEYLQSGWQLAGFEGVRKASNGDYYLQDQQVFPAVTSQEKIVTYDQSGIRRSFEKLESSLDDYFHLMSLQDMYGNLCRLQYDAQNRLSNVMYKQDGSCKREVLCSYCPKSGQLLRVSSLLGDKVCFDTEITYKKDQLVQIISRVNDEDVGEPQPPAEFRYDELTGFMCWLKCRLDAQIEVFYAENTGVVARYHELGESYRGDDKGSVFEVTATGFTDVHHRSSFYETVTIWSPSSRIGTTWRHSVEPDTCGYVIAEEFGSKQDKHGHIVPRRSSHYHYCRPAFECLPKISQIITVEKIPGRKTSQTFELFEYDAQGNLRSASDGKTLTKKEYVYGPTPFNVPLLKSAILYDVTKSAALTTTQILKAERFTHKFNLETGTLLETSHQRAMTADTYTNPVKSEFDERGRLRTLINGNGIKYHYKYDRFGYVTEEEFRSGDDQNHLRNHFKYCPRTGQTIEQKQWNGATKFYDRDGFGNLFAEYQHGSNTAASPRICMFKREVRWREQVSAYVETMQIPAGNESGICNILTIFDGLGRPQAKAVEIEPGTWEVVLQTYDVRKKMAAQTLPFTIMAAAGELAVKIHSRKNKLLWERTYFDDLGRVTLVKQPDGSKTLYQYFKRKDGTTIEEVTSVNRSGKKEMLDRREMTASGEVHYRKSADIQETVQKLDILGRVMRETSGLNQHIDFEYDLLGNCIAENHSKFGQTRHISGLDLQIHLQQNSDHTVFGERDWLGHPLNLKAGANLTAINCSMVFGPVYSLMFGYDFPETLRWSSGFGAWFLTASFLGSICVHINRAYHGQPAIRHY